MGYPLFFKIARVMQGITQKEVGLAAGVSTQAINIYENGRGTLSLETLSKIAARLNINQEYLTDPTDTPFLSNDILIMSIPAAMPMQVVYQLLYFLAKKTEMIEVLFLHSNTIFAKRLMRCPKVDNPIMAIACRDSYGNIFLFKRQNTLIGPIAITGDREFKIDLNNTDNSLNKFIITNDKEISDKQLREIRDATIARDELEEMFGKTHSVKLTKGEEQIIAKMREKGIEATEILRFMAAIE